jgi:ABC-type nitrate/sulfonate/bicarbonate transport system substrate-binding protein
MNAHATATRFRPTDVYYTVCPVASAVSIAVGRGELQAAFEGTGVRLHNIRHSPDRAVREAHYDQTQANLFREGGNIPPLWARSEGRNLRLIGVTWIEQYAAVLALPRSGIRTPADLKGKKLGLVRRPNDQIDYARATGLRGFLTALKVGEVDRSQVSFVDIAIDEPLVAARPAAGTLSSSAFSATRLRKWDGLLVKALYEGAVDAIYITGPAAELESVLNAHVVFDTREAADPFERINNTTPLAFTVRGELLESDPDIVAAYVAQNIRTARWAKANPGEAIRYIARDSGSAEELVPFKYSPNVVNALEPSLDESLVRYLEDQKRFLLQEGFLHSDFSIQDFVAPQPLAQARKIVDAEQLAPTSA